MRSYRHAIHESLILNPILNPKLFRTLFLAALFLAGVCAFAQEPANRQQPVKPFRIIGNIYYVGMSDVASYLITTPEGNILIDSTFEETVPTVRNSIEQLGFPMRNIKILLNSHAHIDHLGGHKLMKELSGAQVMMSEPDAAVLADGGRSDFRNRDGRQRYQPLKSDRILHDGDEVRLGGITLAAHLTPGHTKGCTTWTTTVEDQGKKYNVVFLCGVTGYDEGVPLLNNPKYPTLAEDYAKSLKVAKSLPCDVFLGMHARLWGLEEKMKRMAQGAQPNPFIDPEGYKAYLDAREQRYQEELAKERAAAH